MCNNVWCLLLQILQWLRVYIFVWWPLARQLKPMRDLFTVSRLLSTSNSLNWLHWYKWWIFKQTDRWLLYWLRVRSIAQVVAIDLEWPPTWRVAAIFFKYWDHPSRKSIKSRNWVWHAEANTRLSHSLIVDRANFLDRMLITRLSQCSCDNRRHVLGYRGTCCWSHQKCIVKVGILEERNASRESTIDE